MNEVLKEIEFLMDDVEKIYIGKGDHCRCGCGGEYYNNNVAVDKAKIQRAVKKFLKLTSERDVISIKDYILEMNVSKNGERDWVYTIYLNEDKYKIESTNKG